MDDFETVNTFMNLSVALAKKGFNLTINHDIKTFKIERGEETWNPPNLLCVQSFLDGVCVSKRGV